MLDKRLKDLTIVPLGINYERALETGMFSNELQGAPKVKESLTALLTVPLSRPSSAMPAESTFAYSTAMSR